MWLGKMSQILVTIALAYVHGDAQFSLRKECDPVTQRVTQYFSYVVDVCKCRVRCEILVSEAIFVCY